jgi:hypothetical protein
MKKIQLELSEEEDRIVKVWDALEGFGDKRLAIKDMILRFNMIIKQRMKKGFKK